MTYQRYSSPFTDRAHNFRVGDLIGHGWNGHAKGKVIVSEPIDESRGTWRIVWINFETDEEDEWVGPGDFTDRRMMDNGQYVIEEELV